MSVLGKGAFMCTYRMQHRLPPASGAQCVRGFAVKMMEREDMERQGVTEDDVRREARTLALMRHSHVIRYFGLYESEDELGMCVCICMSVCLCVCVWICISQ